MNGNSNRTRFIRPVRQWRSLVGAGVASVAFALIVSAAMASGGGGGGGGAHAEFEDVRMIIEFNDTDQDIGIQIFIDGEPWQSVKVFDPNGHKIMDIKATRGIRKQGLGELFFESGEPTLDELPLEVFLARFPEGEYEFEGKLADGHRVEGEATFTHAIPQGPELISPAEGSEQDPGNTVVEWNDVPDPPGSTIVAYQVIVTLDSDDFPERELSMIVPASVTSVTIPAEFMQSGSDYQFEVLAIEAGGNQTISESSFSTSP